MFKKISNMHSCRNVNSACLTERDCFLTLTNQRPNYGALSFSHTMFTDGIDGVTNDLSNFGWLPKIPE
jgi:hypothetical protein